MVTSLVRSRISLLCVVGVISIGTFAAPAKADKTYIDGIGYFSVTFDPLPALHERIDLPGIFGAAIQTDLGFVADYNISIHLDTFISDGDELRIEEATFDWGGGQFLTLEFDNAVYTPGPDGPIFKGAIDADITGSSSPGIPAWGPNHFKGGSFALTFQNAKLEPGTGLGGGGRVVFPIGSNPSASFSIVTPEPASVVMTVLGAIGAIGLCVRLRRA